MKPTGTPHLYGSNLGTPCSNPAANAGIPQQDHSNTQAILQQYYNDNNIAVIPSTHRNATAIPQPYHCNPPAIPLEIQHQSHRISHQYRSNTAVKQKHFHSNTIAVSQQSPPAIKGLTQQDHKNNCHSNITAIPSKATEDSTSIPHPYRSNPNGNPTAMMGIPQQDHSNIKAIPEQYHNNNIVGIHTALPITQIPQSRHSNIAAIPQQHHRKFHIIPHQSCRNQASISQQYHLNPIENANDNQANHA